MIFCACAAPCLVWIRHAAPGWNLQAPPSVVTQESDEEGHARVKTNNMSGATVCHLCCQVCQCCSFDQWFFEGCLAVSFCDLRSPLLVVVLQDFKRPLVLPAERKLKGAPKGRQADHVI